MAKTLVLLLSLRVLMAALSQSYYVPDESWQSAEVAHRLVYSTGHLREPFFKDPPILCIVLLRMVKNCYFWPYFNERFDFLN